MDVKQALTDGRFRDTLPLEVRDDVVKYLHCPSCAANINFYRKILNTCKKQLSEYFPNKQFFNEEEHITELTINNWSVINCHIQELEGKLRALPKGRKQVAVCRWEDQCTAIINELDIY